MFTSLPSIKRAALAMLKKDQFGEGYSYTQSALQGRYESARRSIATRRQFEALESAGLFRMEIKPDEFCELDDLLGDTYADSAADGISGGLRTVKAQRKAEIARIDRDGVWGIAGEYRTSTDERWEHGDSVWGFVGNDYEGSGYDTDVMSSTIDALRKALADRCPRCGRPSLPPDAHPGWDKLIAAVETPAPTTDDSQQDEQDPERWDGMS